MNSLLVSIYSFGYIRSGIPVDDVGHGGGFVFDCRFLPNPAWEIQFASKCGLDVEVREYFAQYPIVEDFLRHVSSIVDMTVDQYRSREFTNLLIAFGCTGGQHRSVYCAERLSEYLQSKGIETNVVHSEQGVWWWRG